MGIRRKVVIVSDSHGQNHNLKSVLKREKPYDMLIHCGDYEDVESELVRLAGCDVHVVAGNMDSGSNLPEEKLVTLGSHKLYVVHGHRSRLYAGLQNLYYSALEHEADYVIFGHLHRPIIETYSGITMLNPGSITAPRQEDRRPTYMILQLMDNGEVEYEMKYV